MAIERVHLNKLPAGLRNIYSKAEDLIRKNGNYDYGITLLKDLVKAVPGFGEARDLLRFAEKERSVRIAGMAKLSGSLIAMGAVFKGKMVLRKNPMEALSFAEDAIAGCYNEKSLYFLYQVAKALEDNDLAIDAMERVYELNPDNESLIHEFIDLLEGIPGHAGRVLQLRQKIVALHPKDLKAQTALRAAAAAATMEQNAAKAEEEKNKVTTRDNGTNTPDLSDLERGDRIIRSVDDIKEMIRRYEEVVASGGGTVDVLRKLAEFYQKADMHEQAINTFQTLSEKQGVADITVDKAIEKSTVAMANQQLQELVDSGASEDEINSARESILQYQIDCGKQRMEKFPNDLQLHYEQGMLFFDAGRYQEAIPEFEISAKVSQRKDLSMTYIGRCYASLGEYEKSVEILKDLLKDKNFMDTQKMRTLYYLGCTYELMKDEGAAQDCFKQIYDSNPNYMDVAKKVKLDPKAETEE